MKTYRKNARFSVKPAGTLALAIALAGCLSFPSLAFAKVKVDETELAQGENAVGGGTATLAETALDMIGVTASELFIDEDLSVNFNGENDIDLVKIEGSAEVDVDFSGDNEVDDFSIGGQADVTIEANGHNEFEEVTASGDSNVTINVTGENDFEEINGYDDASITIQGTDCQKKDIINLGEDENDASILTEDGDLVIDHVTVNLESKVADIGSTGGDVKIDTSKIARDDDNECTSIVAGGTMDISESVIDIAGTVRSVDKMTIEHSDVKVEAPDSEYDDSVPYRVFSYTGIDLIGEKNGEVKEGDLDGQKVSYVDTGDGDDVDLKADGKPAYYNCDTPAPAAQPLPKTGDESNPLLPLIAALASAACVAFVAERKRLDA